MKKIIISIITFVMAVSASAQFKMSVGPMIGGNINFYSGSDISNLNTSVNGFGVAVGGQADMQFTPVIGLLATLTVYDGLSASGTTTRQGTKTVLNFNNGFLMLNPSLKFSIPTTGFSFYAGPGIGIKLHSSTEAYQVVDGLRQPLQEKTDAANVNPHITAQVGAMYDFDLGSGVKLAPHIALNLGLNNAAEAVEVKMSNIQFGLTCKFAVVGSKK